MNIILKTHKNNYQSGSTLVIALVLLAVMTILGLSAMNNSIIQEKLAGHFEAGVTAMQNAETGISDSIKNIEKNYDADEIDLILQNGNKFQTSAEKTNNIYYNVNVIDNDDGDGDLTADTDGIFLLNSTGSLNSAERNVVMRVSLSDGTIPNTYAILTEEPIELGGRSRIDGSFNHIHSNGSVKVGDISSSTSNTAADSGHVSSSTSIDGKDKIKGTHDDSAAVEIIPDIIPSEFIGQADYILKNGGTIIDTATGLTVSPGSVGWKYSSGAWGAESEHITEALYYSETNLTLSKSIGSSGTPWKGGFLSEGYIEISGEFNIDSSGHNNLMFLAADDIKLNGSGLAIGEGLIGTQGQIEISGEVSIEGFIISKGANTSGTLVAKNLISGQTNVNHDDNKSPFGGGFAGVQRLSWQQKI